MTAGELYAIVKDVPREAWPAGWRWIRDKAFFWHDVYCTSLCDWNDADQVVLVFEASMMRWLCERHYPVSIKRRPRRYAVSAFSGDEAFKSGTGGSLVEAIAAACKAVSA